MVYAVLKHKVSDEAYRDYALANPITTLGRSSSNDIVINDSSISRLHVRFENRNGHFFIVDNNSSNGTFLNRRKITEAPLKDGDTVMAGRVYFYFVQRAKEPDEAGRTQPLTVMDPKPPTGMASTLSLDLNAPKEPGHAGKPSAPPMARGAAKPSSGEWSQEFTPTEDIVTAQEKADILPPTPPPQFGKNAPPPPPAPRKPSAPPAPRLGVTPRPRVEKVRARPLRRLLAYLIDAGIFFVLYLPGVVSMVVFPKVGGLLMLAGALVGLFHLVYGWLKYGKTLGKHWMGIRIIETGQSGGMGLSGMTIVKRLFGYMVSSIFALGFLYILLNEEGLGFHDKIAGTEVIED